MFLKQPNSEEVETALSAGGCLSYGHDSSIAAITFRAAYMDKEGLAAEFLLNWGWLLAWIMKFGNATTTTTITHNSNDNINKLLLLLLIFVVSKFANIMLVTTIIPIITRVTMMMIEGSLPLFLSLL